MKKCLHFLLYFLLAVIFYCTNIKHVYAQNPTTGYISCASVMNCESTVHCQPGYRVPDECLADPNQCCWTLPYGHCEVGGACYCQAFIDCVPETQPTPTSAPNCPQDWECLTTDQNTCTQYYHGTWTPCNIAPGQNGTCCRPPDQGSNSCTNEGGYCRIPNEQTIPGSCEWNEIELPFSCVNWGFPQDTLCCRGEYVASCTQQLHGTCRAICGPDEFPQSGINDCSNPILYPPSGWSCCVQVANPTHCTGWKTGLLGECHLLLGCPVDNPWDGINIPNWVPVPSNYPTSWPLPGFYNQCKSFESCCLLVTPTIVPMPELSPNCTVNGEPGINTAIGCIPITSQTNLLTFVLPWAIGVGSGTAFILIVVGGFLFMTSGGNPQRARAAKQLLTSAIAGLLMIIFSVYILDLIGIRIFNLPGL